MTVIEKRLTTFLDDSYELPTAGNGFRWIHVPVNNMGWAEV